MVNGTSGYACMCEFGILVYTNLSRNVLFTEEVDHSYLEIIQKWIILTTLL